MSYQRIIEEFNKRNCKLLTTNIEYNELIKNKKSNNYKLNYIASCGHIHNVFFNVFKSRNTGIICPNCKTIENKNIQKNIIINEKRSKIYKIEQEYLFINKFCESLKPNFEIIKAFDGCNVDIIFKPKTINDDKWVGIQVKTTKNINLTYSFHINNLYKNCLILLYCCEDEKMWLIPENIIQKQQKLSIGYNKSKYNIYNIDKQFIVEKLIYYYNITSKYSFNILNTPICIYQQREQDFINFRKEKIYFLNFINNNMEGTVYDFKIQDLKFQEKIAQISKENRYKFFISKNNGKKKIQYDIGDNDFYWLNCADKKTFFVIPEKVLINKGFIGNKNKYTVINITVKDKLNNKSSWLEPYMFSYENINETKLKNNIFFTNV